MKIDFFIKLNKTISIFCDNIELKNESVYCYQDGKTVAIISDCSLRFDFELNGTYFYESDEVK